MSETLFQALPDEETIGAFREKGYAPALSRFSYRDVWAGEHARMFTVAKALSDDVLQTLRAGVDDAIANGTTFEDFKKVIEPKLRDLGWWGRGTMVDPKTARSETVQLGSALRLRIIYDTNLRSARAAGRWERAQRNKGLMPFFQYFRSTGRRSARRTSLSTGWCSRSIIRSGSRTGPRTAGNAAAPCASCRAAGCAVKGFRSPMKAALKGFRRRAACGINEQA